MFPSMGLRRLQILLLLTCLISSLTFAAVNTSPPSTPVKLIFIHHSTGGNWLADANQDMPYGELGKSLMNNNYFVSATNYDWGPDGIGSRTDIVNWPEWFVSSNSTTVLNQLYTESGQNVGDFGAWSRLANDPGGENTIVMFKSCFPNSDLYGEGSDAPASEISDAYTVSNAKAIYNELLTYFETRQDKLFIVITAPPQNENEYSSDEQTPSKRAENARAFNNWLINDWLKNYTHKNVAVFDYFNVLTGADNHHRVTNGEIEHVTATNNNFAAYPNSSYDSHPNTTGQQKATTELVPILNSYYQSWLEDATANDNGDEDTGDTGDTDASDTDNSGTDDSGDTNGMDDPTSNPTGDSTDQTSSNSSGRLIQPSELVYLGAFRLPDGSNGVNWSYAAGDGMTYYPKGDPQGPADNYPGSLFASGFDPESEYAGDTEMRDYYVSEISIPVPVISASKDIEELNTASTLQPFQDIGIPKTLILGRIGLSYLEAQGDQTTDKLYFCYGEHIQGTDPSHGWAELNLSAPNSQGPWIFGDYTNYVTNDYLFEIPKDWADSNTPGQLLATGRIREGLWSGQGPALFAYGPWNDGNPPEQNATLQSYTPLLLYGVQEEGAIDIVSDETTMMNGYSVSDDWSGGAWLTAGDQATVAFIGTKAVGKAWYGFANGVEWDYECAEQDPPNCPDVPDWPYDDRGYWADDYKVQIIFYDPDDLAAVANGTKQTYDPQPYASLDLDAYFFDPNASPERYKRQLVGAMSYDSTNHLLYVFERMADGINGDEKGLIHVWKISPSSVSDGDTDSGDAVTPDDGNTDDNNGANVDNGNTNADDGNTSSDSNDTASSDNNDDETDSSNPNVQDPGNNNSGSSGGGCFIAGILE